MANVARKSIAAVTRAEFTGPNLRDQLRHVDDSAVVSAFLNGEERAFSELVERYQTRLLNFIYRTIGDTGEGRGSRARGLHSGVSPLKSVRPFEEILDLGLHHRLEPRQERTPEPLPQSAGPVSDHHQKLAGRGTPSPIRGFWESPRRPIPQARYPREGRRSCRKAPRTPPERICVAGA